MTKQPFRFNLFLLICLSIPLTATAQTVDIPDPNLRAVIERNLDKASGDIITAADMATLTQLRAPIANISDLTGLDAATNLTNLNLRGNSISDISPVAGLTNLTVLLLNRNSISDISPVTGLTNLAWLWLSGNSISNISAVAGLTNLTELEFESNSISDISAIAGLTNLGKLHLAGNSITDISAVAGLTNLTSLRLNTNFITDLSPLVENTGLGSGDWVNVKINLLNADSINTHIPVLQSRGVTVEFDNIIVQPEDPAQTVDIPDPVLRAVIERNIGKASGATITGADMARLTSLIRLPNFSSIISDLTGLEYAINLKTLSLRSNRISDLSPLAGLTNLTLLALQENQITEISAVAGLTNLTRLSLEYNNITDLSPLVENTGLGSGDTVDVRGNPLNAASINTHIPALQNRGVEVSFDDVIAQLVDVPDPNLRAVIENALGKASGDTITVEDIATLTELFTNNANISDLTGLEHATNLTELQLHNNVISDISAITDISPLAGLTNLTVLWLYKNAITDISPIAGLTNLTELRLYENTITDISPIAGLTNLTELALGGNNITDISAVAGLTNLTILRLWGNSISDISPIAENTGLASEDFVDVRENFLNAPSVNIHIPALQSRGVEVWFDDIVVQPEDIVQTVDIPDPNLRAVIENARGKASGDTITVADMLTLPRLFAFNANISDLTGLEAATNLTQLGLGDNNITDISAIAGLTNLTRLWLANNSISDISALAGLTNLTRLWFWENSISDISALAGLTNLIELRLEDNDITDISAIAGLTNLTEVGLYNNSITDISAVAGLTQLTRLGLWENSITDISAVAGLTNLTALWLYDNSISDISAVAGLTNLTELLIANNSISDISPVAGLTHLTELLIANNSISDISPLVANTGLGRWDRVDVSENPLNDASINTHIPTLQCRGVTVRFENLKPTTLEYLLSIPAGTNLIHVPLKVTAVDGVAGAVESIGDLYDALGDAVNFIITLGDDGNWISYLGDENAGSAADAAIGDDTGLVVVMSAPKTLELVGDALGTAGASMINIDVGNNLVGVPLQPEAGLSMISDLLLDGVGAIAVSKADGMGFHTIREPGQDGDGPIVGGVGYFVVYTGTEATSITIVGSPWENSVAVAAAPAVAFDGTHTPVLYVEGGVMDEFDMLSRVPELCVTVKNLSTGASLDTVLGTKLSATAYSGTFVELSRHAAKVGDVLEVVAHSTNPYVGIRPVPQIVVSTEEVLTSRISLPDLELYEIPSETELLANYPNPFNPETWIPYQLADARNVQISIYNINGALVRQLDLGYQRAGYYTDRSRAAYWDGTNEFGERVATGVYFYRLQAAQTGYVPLLRKMVILK